MEMSELVMVKVGISRRTFFFFFFFFFGVSNKYSVVIQMCACVCARECVLETCFMFVSCSAERKHGRQCEPSALGATSH